MKRVRGILSNEKTALRTAMILLAVWGVILTFMIPSWQTPDEYTHLGVIADSWENPQMAEYLVGDMDLDQSRIIGQYDEKVDVDAWRAAMTKAPSYSRADVLPKGVKLSVLKHLPASIGIFLGLLLHLPTFWVMELGELSALAAALALCALALRLMPVKKQVLLMIMAFPMTMQQLSLINYDSVLLPLCFVFVAYIFYLRMTKEAIGWRNLILTAVLLGLITYIKIPYVFFGLLIFLLPKEKFCLKIGRITINGEIIRKRRVPVLIALVLLIAVGIYLKRDNQWIQIVLAMFLEPRRGAYLFWATWKEWREYLFTSCVGQFGWLETAVPKAFVWITYIMVFVLSFAKDSKNGNALKIKGRMVVWFTFVILCLFVCMSMINHTIMITLYGAENAEGTYVARQALYQIPYIGGLQGRYFLPFLALPFLTIPGIGKKLFGRTWIVVGYIIAAMVLTLTILSGRYWIA
ncbi:MAG: DUF2142 domain-containing protein [Clostridiales bacterium]|nr:DUF2142 domain-containing protein [Clostridiales bacterium]